MSDAGQNGSDVAQLVVIGSSAGGVEALLELVANLPASLPVPIVVAQHLDPHRPSQLSSILASRTRLPVQTVLGQEQLTPGTIYVVPADRDVEISDHHVNVLEPAARASKPSIDRLMATAARVYGDGLISVILTGTGNDGAAGAQATKAYGGTVIIQNPETARFPGMPQAVPHAAVDIVADLEAIGPLLVDLVTGAFTLPQPESDDELQSFLDQVRDRTGLDFSAYKRPTILRRLQRRMAAVDRDSLADYRRYVNRHPDEAQRLVASFLIKVTEFFRDPELFAYLREQVLPGLIDEARVRGELRIWSAGCATGEEAYSIAMLVAELLDHDLDTFPVRIFATDVALDAVDFARRGVYTPAALASVPPDLMERYFTYQDGSYEVRKSLRSLVIFGDHDLSHRAPFPRIDLVLCRNVLIYFTTELQRRSLQLFAFSLRSGGYLVLGKSETVSPLPEFFALEQPRLKVFRRIGSTLPIPASQVLGHLQIDASASRIPRRLAHQPPLASDQGVGQHAMVSRHEQLLDALSVGVVTVNRHYDVLSINGAARRLLGINTGAIGEDLIHRVNPRLAVPLRAALDAALRGEVATTAERLPRDLIDGEGRELAIVCSPLQGEERGAEIHTVLVEVTDITAEADRRRTLEEAWRALAAEQETLREQSAAAIAELRELREVNRKMASDEGHLRMEVDLLQLAHEEAQAAAEEIETLNEEQQATNEELETVNEELQATIEELQATVGELSTTNDELQTRSVQLEQMAGALDEQRQMVELERSRLAAILANMGDAVLVVNEAGEPTLTNAAFDSLFGEPAALVPQDEIGHVLPEDEWPQRRAASGEIFTLSFTLPDADGGRRYFETNVQQVQRDGGERSGIIVIRDITERSLRRQQEQFLAVAAHELRTPLTVLSGRVQLLARRLASANADERLRDHANRALEQARHLEADIDELLDAARAQFRTLVLEREPLDLVSVARQAVEMAEGLTHGQTIHVELPGDAVTIDGDRRRLERVLLNVLTNAITYAPGTPQIDVRLRVLSGNAIVEIEDRGPGIPPEFLPQLFSRFTRLDSGTASRGGLGLGLYIAREIIHGHGGTIEARSTVGEGTTIVIRLPLLAVDTAADQIETSSPA